LQRLVSVRVCVKILRTLGQAIEIAPDEPLADRPPPWTGLRPCRWTLGFSLPGAVLNRQPCGARKTLTHTPSEQACVILRCFEVKYSPEVKRL